MAAIMEPGIARSYLQESILQDKKDQKVRHTKDGVPGGEPSNT